MSAKPKLDPRTAPFRPDLAAAFLYGKVEAERYVDGVACQIRTGFTSLRETGDWESRQGSQLLFGETFTVFEEEDGWAWGQNGTDDYVGYLRLDALEEAGSPATHQVSALRSYLFAEPDLKTPPLDLLPFQARIAAVGEQNKFIEIAGGGWIYHRHVQELGSVAADPVATALRFLGTPYLWGGRTSLGLDCSALVQLALAASGIQAPRDTDLQRAALGTVVSKDGKGVSYQRGDLVFLPGHVGLMADADTLVHANAFHMEVAAEPLADVLARAGENGIISVNRL